MNYWNRHEFLKLKIDFYLHLVQLQTSDFQFSSAAVVVVILLPHIRQILEAYPGYFSYLSLRYVFIKTNLNYVFILITWGGCLKLAFYGLYIYVRSLTIYSSTEQINWELSSKVKPQRSPRLVSLNSFNFAQKRCSTWKDFRARRVFNKTIILLGLAGYEIIITYAPRWLFIISYSAFSAPS